MLAAAVALLKNRIIGAQVKTRETKNFYIIEAKLPGVKAGALHELDHHRTLASVCSQSGVLAFRLSVAQALLVLICICLVLEPCSAAWP